LNTSRAAKLREVFTQLFVIESPQRMPGKQESMIEPLDEAFDHVRGPATASLIVEYGDYECPYSRQAFRSIERVEAQLGEGIRFAFRQFPLTEIHPHALAASRAAEAAALQERFWRMHELLFRHQHALADDDLRGYAIELALDVARFDTDRSGEAVLERSPRRSYRRRVPRSARYPDAVHRRSGASRRLRRANPAGGVGEMNAVCTHFDPTPIGREYVHGDMDL
jgi:Thioredoxin